MLQEGEEARRGGEEAAGIDSVDGIDSMGVCCEVQVVVLALAEPFRSSVAPSASFAPSHDLSPSTQQRESCHREG
jgi:hypothetical protein